jgi:hypothetical protein
MDKAQAHAILNKCRDGFPMPLAITNQALERTGDIVGPFGDPLCTNGNEQRVNRPCQAHDAPIPEQFSYSKYLDCPAAEGITQ